MPRFRLKQQTSDGRMTQIKKLSTARIQLLLIQTTQENMKPASIRANLLSVTSERTERPKKLEFVAFEQLVVVDRRDEGLVEEEHGLADRVDPVNAVPPRQRAHLAGLEVKLRP